MYTVENWGIAPVEGRAMENTEKVVSEKSKQVKKRVTEFQAKLREKTVARSKGSKK